LAVMMKNRESSRDGKEPKPSKNEPNQDPGIAKNQTEPESKKLQEPDPNRTRKELNRTRTKMMKQTAPEPCVYKEHVPNFLKYSEQNPYHQRTRTELEPKISGSFPSPESSLFLKHLLPPT